MKNIIYSNDVCNMYDVVRANLEEFFSKDEIDDVEDDQIWDVAYREVEIDLEAEQTNLSVETDGKLILIGTLQRWNGPASAYKELKTRNIGEAIVEAMSAFGGDNTFEIYEEDGGIYISQTGHDNPTNPSIMEFREMTRELEELDNDYPETLRKASIPIGCYAQNVYGWNAA